ncbi:MAG TPA: lysylphosphatidylglycerol synthase transmembrane domain-containing protein [Gaiellaceae bacterium]
MGDVEHAFRVFFDDARAIAWLPVLYALACQSLKLAARSRAWRNILAAAYPTSRVRWRSVFGACAAGAGVNAIVPVRGGDLLRLFLVRRRIEDATYSTLGATLFVETLVDALLSAALLVWALQQHVLPGVHVLNRLPSIDWFWLFRHPRAALIATTATLLLGAVAVLWGIARTAAFRRRVAQGFAVLRTPGRYLRGVVAWQLVDWALRLATIFFFLRAFHIHADFGNALRVQVASSLSTIVPLTPAGIGTEQALVVYVLAGHASRSSLLSLSVGMKAILSAFNAVVGLAAIGLMLRTLSWRRVVERDGAHDHPAT